jgi:glycosyltransferase involved in cell wall biosynthesis
MAVRASSDASIDSGSRTAEATGPAAVASVQPRPRIVAYAYDVHPEHGSEPGAGWGMIRLLAAWSDIYVLTRTTPPELDSFGPWRALHDDVAHVHWVHVPLPGDPVDQADIARWRPGLLARVLPQFDYLRWQVYALRRARALHRRNPFDVAWHVTWANAWLGSTAALIGPPFVMGPVGGGVDPPLNLVPTLGTRGAARAAIRWAFRRIARAINPLARLSWRRARLILVQNPETRAWLPRSARARTRVFQNSVLAVTTGTGRRASRPPGKTAVYAGRLVPMKGVHLAIAALAELPRPWRLVIVGDGPYRSRLEELARDRGVGDRVEFTGAVPRDQVFAVFRDIADVLVFPSLHDEAGLVVAEAMALGVPVVCIAVGGPPVMTGGGVKPGRAAETITALAAAIEAAVGTSPRPLPTFDELRVAVRSALADARVYPASRIDKRVLTGRDPSS